VHARHVVGTRNELVVEDSLEAVVVVAAEIEEIDGDWVEGSE